MVLILLPKENSMKLLKAIVSDFLLFLERVISYVFWNAKGVRITFSCNISRKAIIAKGCVFSGHSIITQNAKIGSFTYGYNVNINNAIVGDYCSLAPDVKIGLDEHPLDKFSTHPHFYDKLEQKNTVIGNHVWLGANAVILCGVTLKENVVVAAGAIVNKDVEEFVIVGGVPAKEIGKRNINAN
jgi:acetyltransferase-like isoleucine patch superfamily enzyme